MQRTRRIESLLVLALLLMCAPVTRADPKTFHASNTDWLNSNNWTPVGVPTSTDDVLITAGTSEMSLTSNSLTIQRITYSNASDRLLRNNTSGATSRTLTLNGDGVNPLISVTSASSTFTLQGINTSGGTGTLGLVLNASGDFNITNAGAKLAISSVISETGGSRSLTKTGAGVLDLSGLNTYTGLTTISGGTLTLQNTGSIAGSVKVGTGATFNVSAFGSGYTVAAGRVLSGTGTVTGKSIIQGTVSPGNSIGSMSVGSEDWAPGGQYTWEVNATTGTAGTNWDFLSVGGTLDITASSGTPFKIKLVSLNGSGNPAPLAGVGPNQNYSWTIATATTVTNFDASKFSFDTADFSAAYGGTWAIQGSSTSISLVYSSVPEPTAAAALLALPLILSRRTRARREGRLAA